MVDRLGKYELLRTLGRGAMGEVYLAHHPVIGREVAIKTILPSAGQGEDAEARFRREATAAGQLNHPNLVTIYDFDRDGEILYLVMEYVKGEDLEEVIREKDLTQSQFLEVLAQICDGLAHAHQAGIIHRDIKPSNVRVVRDGKRLQAKVMDFGIARTEDSNMTNTGIVMGTVSYMAPEYIKSGKATVQADLWAVGVMLYECLAGRKPFHGDNTTTVLFKIVSETPQPLEPGDIHGISPAIREILEKALSKDPSERFFSAEVFAKALRACKDPSWTGTVEQATLAIARHQAAQEAREAQGVLPPVSRSLIPEVPPAVPAPPTAQVAPPSADATVMAPAAVEPTVMAPAPVEPAQVAPSRPPAAPTVVSETVRLPEPARPAVPAEPTVVSAPAVPAVVAASPSLKAADPIPAKPSRTGLYVGLGAAVVLLVAGGAVLATRKSGSSAAPVNPAPTVAAGADAPQVPGGPSGAPSVPPTADPHAASPNPATPTPAGVSPVSPKAGATSTGAASLPGKVEAAKVEPPKVEPAKAEAASPEAALVQSVNALERDPRSAAIGLQRFAYAEKTRQNPKVQGLYLAALYRARSVAEFEKAYDNALQNGVGPKAMLNASPAFRGVLIETREALRNKREGVLPKALAERIAKDVAAER